MPDIQFPHEYTSWFINHTQRIGLASQKVARALKAELIELYKEIGRDIAEKEVMAAWGSGLIETLSCDLTHAFLDIKGFSLRNHSAMSLRHLFKIT